MPKQERTLGGAAFYNIYRTSDGRHVVLGAQEPKFVRDAADGMGPAGLIDLCERGPGPHQRPVIDFLQSVFATRTQAEWVNGSTVATSVLRPVQTLREAFDDPHANARRMHLVDDRGQEHIGLPIKYTAEPGRPNVLTSSQPVSRLKRCCAARLRDAELTALRGLGAQALPVADALVPDARRLPSAVLAQDAASTSL